MKNQKIRNALKEAGVKQWELAVILGIAESTLCVKLRKELPEAEQKRIVELIQKNRK